jgi:serine/threonine protein kinase
MSTSGEERLGHLVEGFRLTSILGTGSTCVVYLGRHVGDPQVSAAIKVLTYPAGPGVADRATFRQRFLREARAASKLAHPHILQVTAFGEVDDLTYMIMPVVTGGTLAAHLERMHAPLPFAQIRAYLDQLASALDYAHQRGIVHRDVKPSNVLMDEQGRLYLTDFGIALLFDAGIAGLTNDRLAALTRTGQVLGTPYYMAPEQITGDTVGPAADIYALGVMLYQMVTGQIPFRGESLLAVALQHVQEEPRPPALLRLDLPPEAEAVIVRALAKRPGDRFTSAGALAQAFALGLPAALATTSDPNETHAVSSAAASELAAAPWAGPTTPSAPSAVGDPPPVAASTGHTDSPPAPLAVSGAPAPRQGLAQVVVPGTSRRDAPAPATTSAAPPGIDRARGAAAGLTGQIFGVLRSPLPLVSALVLLALVVGLFLALSHRAAGTFGSPRRATSTSTTSAVPMSTSAPGGPPLSYQVHTYETHSVVPYSAVGDAPVLSVGCGADGENLVSGGYRIDESGASPNTHPDGATASFPSDVRTWSASVHNSVPGSTVTLYVTAYCLHGNFDSGGLVRSEGAQVGPYERASAAVTCDEGYAMAGGFRLQPAASGIVVQSRPRLDGTGHPTGWISYAHDTSGRGATLQVYVLCATKSVAGGSAATTPLTLEVGQSGDTTRGCSDGRLLTGGGFEFPLAPDGGSDDQAELHEAIFVNHIPGAPGPTQQTWKVAAYNGDSGRSGQHTVRLWANCVQLAGRVSA